VKKLTIIIDKDCVLAETMEKVLRLYNKEYGEDIKKDDVNIWDLNCIQKPGTDMVKYFQKKGFFLKGLNSISNSKRYINKLIAKGDRILVATASPIEGFVDKAMWLKRHFGNIPIPEHLILIHAKDVLRGDIMLDDGLHNLLPCNSDWPVVFDQPWNRDTDELLRVSTWKEFYSLVEAIRSGEFTYSELLKKQEKEVSCIYPKKCVGR